MAKFHVWLKETVLTPILVEAATEVEAIKKAEAGVGEPMPFEQEVLERHETSHVERVDIGDESERRESSLGAVPLTKRQAGYDPGDVETGACPKCGQRMMTNIDPAGKVEQECLCGNKVKHPAASAEDEGLSGQTNMSEAEGEERKAASLTRRQEIKEGGS